ncbi:MAG: DUF3343 domain-containing protein [Deltaproteobacteria bacterium]|nr:DUF3343 domain-containing protein [Candidatus Tharpella sp.]
MMTEIQGKEEMELYLIFHSIHNVMLAEELLLEADIPVDMIPVPREISSDCGMSLACNLNHLNQIRATLEIATFTSKVMVYEHKKVGQKSDCNFQLVLTI